MEISEEMDVLLDSAEAAARSYLKAEGNVPTFALVLQADGDVATIASEGYAELAGAIGAILAAVLPMVERRQAVATLICSSLPAAAMDEPGLRAAMFDMEDHRHNRVYAVLPFRARDYGGWAFRPMEFSRGSSQVFSDRQPPPD